MPLYQELIDNYATEYIAGGATQNSIRVAQWMLRKFQSPDATAFIGCVGQDKFGETLKTCATRDGVAVYYRVDENLATGTCAVLVRHGERSLVANLAAANAYTLAHLTETSEVQGVCVYLFFDFFQFVLTKSSLLFIFMTLLSPGESPEQYRLQCWISFNRVPRCHGLFRRKCQCRRQDLLPELECSIYHSVF